MRPAQTLYWTHAVTLACLLLAGCNSSAPTISRVDRVLIEKSERRLSLLAGGVPVRVFQVALGGNPDGDKEKEGDQRTPEGTYSINRRNDQSGFHRALQVSYPDAQDRAEAAAKGVDPGGLIMIHGIRNGLGWLGRLHRMVDWTDGCIAVTNSEMDEIWDSVPLNTPVEIRP